MSDSESNLYNISRSSKILIIIGIVFRLISVFGTIFLIYSFYDAGETSNFYLTLSILIFNFIGSNLFEYILRLASDNKNKCTSCFEFHNHEGNIHEETVNDTLNKKVKIIGHNIISWATRNGHATYYLIKYLRYRTNGNKQYQKKFYFKVLEKQEDGALMKLFDACTVTATQITIQLSIILMNNSQLSLSTHYKILIGLIALPLTSVGYSIIIRENRNDKHKIHFFHWSGAVVTFCHFCLIFSKIIALSACASLAPVQTIIYFCARIVFMFLVVFFFDRPNVGTNIDNLLISFMIGCIYSFHYILSKELSRAFWRYFTFYSLTFLEIVIFLSVYAVKSNVPSIFLICISFTAFFVGVISLVFYYERLHPNKEIRYTIVNWVTNSLQKNNFCRDSFENSQECADNPQTILNA